MAKKTDEPVVIKKYANRRLYNTGTSTYVTLEDLAGMVKAGEDFIVYDAKTGEEITRSVLAQIIFEQENKEGQNLLPIAFLRQLIRFYGDSMQMLVPRYLEVSIDSLTREQEKFRHQVSNAFGGDAAGGDARPARGPCPAQHGDVRADAFAMFAPLRRGEAARQAWPSPRRPAALRQRRQHGRDAPPARRDAETPRPHRQGREPSQRLGGSL